MKIKPFITTLALSSIATTVTAADIGGGVDLSGNVTFASEYFWRGMDQNSGAPAMQGGMDLAHESGLYFGIWTSNINFGGGDTSQEVDYYGGFANEVGWLGYDIGAISYQYPGNTGDLEFEEAYVGLSTTLASIDIGFTAINGASAATDAYEFSLGTAIGAIGISGTVGEYDDFGDYMTLSVSTEILPETYPLEISLAYTEIDADEISGLTTDDEATILSVSKSF